MTETMTLKYVIIRAIIITMLGSSITSAAFASNGLTNEENPFRTSQGNRPAINPDFDPNFDCIYDVSQIRCIPGSAQECPKPQFSAGDPEMCFPKTLVDGEWKWVCPEDHHTIEDDETGQCYPNEEECPDGMILEEASRVGSDLSDSCIEYAIDCDLNEDHPLCNGEERSDGIKVCDQPDHPGYKFCI